MPADLLTRRRRTAATLLAFALPLLSLAGGQTAARAEVTLPALFTPNLVLQRGMPLRVWGKASPGEKVTVGFDGNTTSAMAGADGAWEVKLKPHGAGGPYTLHVAGQNTVDIPGVLVGEVWVCSGQSNMEFPLSRAANAAEVIPNTLDPQMHLFHVRNKRSDTPVDDVRASWQECTPKTVGSFSAVGYFFGRDLRKALGVPIGLIESDWGGTPAQSWTRADVLDANPDLKKLYTDPYPAEQAKYEKAVADYAALAEKAKADGKPEPRKPSAPWKTGELYNGMIAPLTRFAIRGAIWYQGESNTGNSRAYRTLFPTMIENWRSDFDRKDLPFLAVQLAPFGSGNDKGLNYAELREAQYLTTQKLPNVGIAVITDVGDEGNIHPTRKEPAGQRLALLAEKMVYGHKIVAMGPTYKSMAVKGSRAVLRFDNTGEGLTVRGGETSGATVPADTLVGFTVAGADGKFVPAEAKITGKDTVEVSSPEVPEPKAVRFGFVNFPVVNLWNENGLPANPFRTDQP